ncbi:intron-binding aquarius [Brachionus plicatilis]|uniref:Intron-binding aquarius n=1 Tax=Brachionus plicatilis TaxID=10195 RepID=A0A3M7QX35_BRAPC|nr:intron-binding aquarius [Brachionus plicatilis]
MSNNDNQRIAIPTVDQIAKDAITQIAHRFWSQQDATKPLEPFDPNLIEDIYLNELLKTNFSLRRIMLLEFSQYLENYLWKNFQSDQTTKAHLLSIVIMVNEKFRERVFAWDCFRTHNQSEFPAFFTSILHLCLDKSTQGQPYQLSYQEQSILIKFLDNCINSLEVEIVRLQVQKICGFPMWASVCENRRDFEFKQFPKLKKYWKAIQKQDQKLSQTELDKVNFERFFFKNLINKFLKVISNCPKQEDGQLDEDFKYSTNYLERFIELLVDIESLLPTRRFFNTLLDDTNLLSHCCLSDMVKNSDQKYNLFKQLFEMLKFYVKFEIDDQTGEAKTEPQVLEYHYNKLKSLQRGVFKYFREDLLTFSLTNISTIDKRDTLLKHLSGLSNDRLYSLAEYLHLVPSRESIQDLEYSSEFLIEVIVWHMQLRDSQLDVLNSMPLYPTEDIIWNETLVPSDFRQTTFHDTCLALPKLNLQFLTLNDYLMRNFNLFRLEAAYELRQDIEDACIRLKPYYSFEEQTVCFGAWSRMAQPIANFTLTEVGSPNVGEQAPSRVKADVTLDLDFLRDDVRKEWESLRKHDIGFLVTLRPTFSKEQKYDPKDSFLRQMGLLCVRGCEIEGMLGPEGKLIEEGPMYSKPKFTDASRTYRVHLDRNQYKIDNEKFVATKSKEDLYTTFNVFIRRRPKENNFKSILESIRDLMNTNFVVPDWLSDLLLGYGEPNQAHYRSLKKPEPIPTLDFYDTFLDYDHLKASFPGYQLVLKDGQFSAPFRLSFEDLKADINEKKIIVEPYVPINRGPYPKNIPKKNQVKFTPTQIEAIKSG